MADRPRWLLAIPTAITLGNALCGFTAVVLLAGWTPAAGPWAVATAGWLILAAWVCDMLDGLAARMTGTSGAFGAALDSLCDVVGFGVAPAFLVGTLAQAAGLPPAWGWIAGGALLSGVLIRLARFDAEDAGGDEPDGHLWFRGLPSPVVGTLVATLALTWAQAVGGTGALAWLDAGQQVSVAEWLGRGMPVAGLLLAVLAVTTLRYPDLPKHYMLRLAPRWHLAVLVVAMAALGPGLGLLAFFLAFTLFGPLVGRRAAAPGGTSP